VSPVRPDGPSRLVRAVVFAGLGALGLWHVSRLQSPSLGVGDLVLPIAFALALALAAARSRRAFALGALLWVVGVAVVVGDRAPSRAQPFAPFTAAVDRLHEGGARFASVFLPFDPTAEPAVHGLLVAVSALWLAALALVWLVWRRPLPTVVVGALPVAIASTEFPLPHPGLRVALLAGLALVALSSGRQAGAPAIAALAAPLVLVALVAGSVPGVARAGLVDWRAWGGSSGGTGSSAAADVRYAWDQSYDGLHYAGDPTVVLHVRSARPSYWRVTVLDSFDGLRFAERVPAARTVPAGAVARVEPAPGGATTHVQVEVDALDEPYLVGAGVPVSYTVPASTGGGTVDANGVVRLLRPPSRGTRYDVSAVIADPTAAELRARTAGLPLPAEDDADAVPFDGGGAVPGFAVAGREPAVQAVLAGRPAWQRAYAWAVRETAGARTPYDVALRLQQALDATHGYDGAATLPPDDPDALAHWVVDGQAGYCQMFSASMTELLRLLGVPARIVEGFDTGVYDPSSKSYVIDDRDAHAWVEAWLPGSGFVPFDPTPGHSLPNHAALIRAKPSTRATPRTTPRPGPAHAPVPAHHTSSVAHRTRAALGRPLLDGLVAALVLVLLAAAILLLRRLPSRRSSADVRAAAATARARLRALARRHGVELPENVTNGELAGSLELRFGLDARAWAAAADRVGYASPAEAAAALPLLRAETDRLADELRARGRVTIPV
jgi:transglutaminase-like putative cysteine protease